MGVVNVAVLACVLTVTTKKVVIFFEEKSAPQTKSWYAYAIIAWALPDI